MTLDGGDGGTTTDFAWSPDGRSIATVGDGGLDVWDSHTGDLRFTGTLQCLTRDPSCGKRIVKGTGPVALGTGDFAGAKGKLNISAHAESATNGDFKIDGAMRY